MSLLNKEPVKRVQKALNDYNNDLKIIVLETSARTALDAANSLNCEVGAIIKSLLFRSEKSFFLCLVAGDKKCSLNKLKKITNNKDVSMASPEDVKKKTGYTIGGVSPIGHEDSLEIMVDISLNRFKSIYGAAGHPNCVFKISFDDLIKITKSKQEDIIE
jgi:Cys-tRNA(Pro) deacylase